MPKKAYRLTAPDGSTYESGTPRELGGNWRAKIYGRRYCRRRRCHCHRPHSRLHRSRRPHS